MDVFAFRDELVAKYARFSRSFTRIRAEDISREVDSAYAGGRFWPAPLVQLNPEFEPGGWVDDLVADETLDSECETNATTSGLLFREACPEADWATAPRPLTTNTAKQSHRPSFWAT